MPVVKHVTKRQKKRKKSQSGTEANKKDKNKNAGEQKACAAISFAQQNPTPNGFWCKEAAAAAAAAAVEKPLTRSQIPSNDRRGTSWAPVQDMPPHRNQKISGDTSQNSESQAASQICSIGNSQDPHPEKERQENRGRQPAKLALGHFIRAENFEKIQEAIKKARDRHFKNLKAKKELQEQAALTEAAAAAPAATEISSQGTAPLVAAAVPASPELSSQATLAAPAPPEIYTEEAAPVAIAAAPERPPAPSPPVIRMDPIPLSAKWYSDACYTWRQPFYKDFPGSDQDPFVKLPDRFGSTLNPIGHEFLMARRQRLAFMGGGQFQQQEEQNPVDMSDWTYRPSASDNSLAESIRRILRQPVEPVEPEGFWGPRTIWSWDNHLPKPVLAPDFFPPLSEAEIRDQLSRPPVQVPPRPLTDNQMFNNLMPDNMMSDSLMYDNQMANNMMSDNQIPIQEPTYQSFQMHNNMMPDNLMSDNLKYDNQMRDNHMANNMMPDNQIPIQEPTYPSFQMHNTMVPDSLRSDNMMSDNLMSNNQIPIQEPTYQSFQMHNNMMPDNLVSDNQMYDNQMVNNLMSNNQIPIQEPTYQSFQMHNNMPDNMMSDNLKYDNQMRDNHMANNMMPDNQIPIQEPTYQSFQMHNNMMPDNLMSNNQIPIQEPTYQSFQTHNNMMPDNLMSNNQIPIQEPTYQSFHMPEPQPEQEFRGTQVFQSVSPPRADSYPLADNRRFYPNNVRGHRNYRPGRDRGGQHHRYQNWQPCRQFQNSNNNQYQLEQNQPWLQNFNLTSNMTNPGESFPGMMPMGMPPPVNNYNQNMSYANPMGYPVNGHQPYPVRQPGTDQGASFGPPINNPVNSYMPTIPANGHARFNAQQHQQQPQQQNLWSKGKKGLAGWIIGATAGGSPAGGSLAATVAARKACGRTNSRGSSCPRTPLRAASVAPELPTFKLNKANFPPLPVPFKKRRINNEAGQ